MRASQNGNLKLGAYVIYFVQRLQASNYDGVHFLQIDWSNKGIVPVVPRVLKPKDG